MPDEIEDVRKEEQSRGKRPVDISARKRRLASRAGETCRRDAGATNRRPGFRPALRLCRGPQARVGVVRRTRSAGVSPAPWATELPRGFLEAYLIFLLRHTDRLRWAQRIGVRWQAEFGRGYAK